ncbi:hypothetical protein OOZ54_08190 [Rhodopseudomonas palustris]|uniref:hypothetical protein n=1 Tax=Rhodopseudomonas palustris TaxID=1076 RepID=UPI0022F07A31|nr:hypothetical protein [Rhodopseudomonas palustris]WBU31467.1 hypothetical protein OOZ54_08190 [Rhodopseudomonas palustris]
MIKFDLSQDLALVSVAVLQTRETGVAMRSFQLRDYYFHPCRICGSAANLIRRSPTPSGKESRTYECRKCGQVDVYDVSSNPADEWPVVEQRSSVFQLPEASL